MMEIPIKKMVENGVIPKPQGRAVEATKDFMAQQINYWNPDLVDDFLSISAALI